MSRNCRGVKLAGAEDIGSRGVRGPSVPVLTRKSAYDARGRSKWGSGSRTEGKGIFT
jgi:hypothetical protein